MTHYRNLQAAANAALVGGLSDDLKAAVDECLARGDQPSSILAAVHRQTGGPLARPGGLTYLAVEAYLEQKLKG